MNAPRKDFSIKKDAPPAAGPDVARQAEGSRLGNGQAPSPAAAQPQSAPARRARQEATVDLAVRMSAADKEAIAAEAGKLAVSVSELVMRSFNLGVAEARKRLRGKAEAQGRLDAACQAGTAVDAIAGRPPAPPLERAGGSRDGAAESRPGARAGS